MGWTNIIKTIYNVILRNHKLIYGVFINILFIGTMLAIYYDKSTLPENIAGLQIFEQDLITLDPHLNPESTLNPFKIGMIIDQLFFLIRHNQSIEEIISFTRDTGFIISEINLQKMLTIILEHKTHPNGLPITPELLQKTQILHDTLTERLFGPTNIVNVPIGTKSMLLLGTIITCTLIVFKLIHE